MIPKSLWLIGCGNMAGAMLARWVASGAVDPANILVVNRSDRPMPTGVAQVRRLPGGARRPDAVLLGVKPQQLDAAAADHGAAIAGVPLLVSILAGVTEETLAARFSAGAIVRAMPNLPVAIGKGVVTLHSADAGQAQRGAAAALMAPLGLVEWVEASLFDVATALAGSGPAFVYRFIDALAAGGAAMGMPEEQARRLAIATVEGAGLLASAADVDPATLADRVASPGGSTRAGLDVLDQGAVLRRLVAETLAASARRNGEMGAAFN